MKNKVNGLEDDAIVTGVIIVGGFFLVKKLFGGLGAATQQDISDVNSQLSVAPAANPFNANFQPLLDAWNNDPMLGSDGTPLALTNVLQQIKQIGDTGTLSPGIFTISGLDASVLYNLAEQIESALTGFHFVSSDGSAVQSIFSQITTQTECAAISAYLLVNYGQDLLTLLNNMGYTFRTIVMGDGVPANVLAAIIKQINSLPQ
jgi:hypothetical protein